LLLKKWRKEQKGIEKKIEVTPKIRNKTHFRHDEGLEASLLAVYLLHLYLSGVRLIFSY